MVHRTKLAPLDELRRYRVLTDDGAEVARVDDFVVDLESSQVVYALLSLGPWEQASSRVHPVPCGALRLASRERAFVLKAPRQALEGAPSLERGDVTALADPQRAAALQRHYGLPPQQRAA